MHKSTSEPGQVKSATRAAVAASPRRAAYECRRSDTFTRSRRSLPVRRARTHHSRTTRRGNTTTALKAPQNDLCTGMCPSTPSAALYCASCNAAHSAFRLTTSLEAAPRTTLKASLRAESGSSCSFEAHNLKNLLTSTACRSATAALTESPNLTESRSACRTSLGNNAHALLPVHKSTSESGAVQIPYRHAVEQTSRRWRKSTAKFDSCTDSSPSPARR